MAGTATPRAEWEVGEFEIDYETLGNFELSAMIADGRHGMLALGETTILKRQDGLVIRVKAANRDEERVQRWQGTVTSAGRPCSGGAIQAVHSNTHLSDTSGILAGRRGRAVHHSFASIGAANIGADGSFAIDVPRSSQKLIVTVPGAAPTIINAPIRRFWHRTRPLNIELVPGGAIAGIVDSLPPGCGGEVFVIAFMDGWVHREAIVHDDGSFALHDLPPGKYALKVGHDAMQDPLSPGG